MKKIVRERRRPMKMLQGKNVKRKKKKIARRKTRKLRKLRIMS